MPNDVVFLVCIPTTSYEYNHKFSSNLSNHKLSQKKKNDGFMFPFNDDKVGSSLMGTSGNLLSHADEKSTYYPEDKIHQQPFISMEIMLEELLKKLRIQHVVWYKDKSNLFYEVIFPVPSGDACENCLHSLTELGFGLQMNSVVSVIPTQCTFRGTNGAYSEVTNRSFSDRQTKAWKSFVSSITSKLTVKQVVDGVRSGGDLTFDYLMLVLTADCLAGLGLIENSATNVVAAMLVSPLMGPVMSLTFGTIIADKELQAIGLKSLFFGIFLSILFGFIFGLIIGSTEMPWGSEDWPTPEMKGRGNYRSLWMGVLWALPSGVGVAVALLQGSNGPLIGVAISASLLPPVVNCGLFWALGCTWLIYRPVKMPHIKGESYTDFNTSYTYIYADYLPVEFFCNGIISACLTFINVLCIFITAVVVLKIKEVAAPFTSTPELFRFWNHDISYVRNSNVAKEHDTLSSISEQLRDEHPQVTKKTIDDAISEAMKDETFQKIRRISYGQYKTDQVPLLFGTDQNVILENNEGLVDKSSHYSNCINIKRDLEILEKLLNQIMPTQQNDAFEYFNENNLLSGLNLTKNTEYIPLLSKSEMMHHLKNSLQNKNNT